MAVRAEDRLLVWFAVSKGLLTREQAEQCLAEGGKPGDADSFERLLRQKGYLTEDMLRLLRAVLRKAPQQHETMAAETRTTLAEAASSSALETLPPILPTAGPQTAALVPPQALDEASAAQSPKPSAAAEAPPLDFASFASAQDRRGARAAKPAPTGAPFGKYLLVEELGQGAMGTVYKAVDRTLERTVALKVLTSQAVTGTVKPEEIARFQREARAAARLRHPNIVSVHEVGEQGGRAYFTMDFIPGVTLDRVLRRAAPEGKEAVWTIRQGLEVIRQVADAVGYAHSQGIIHRDLKPENILLDFSGKPSVADFGLARMVLEDGQTLGNTRLTVHGSVMGTPAYMSPEQAAGRFEQLDQRTDIYSLGAILYELLTKRPPYEAGNSIQVIVKILTGDPEPPSQVRENIHRDLETICLKALERDPAQRYASAQEFSEDIGRYLEGESIRAAPPGFWRRLVRAIRRRKGIAAVSAAALLVVAGLLGWFLSEVWQVQQRLRQALVRGREAEQRLLERDREAGEARRRRLEAASVFAEDLTESLALADSTAQERLERADEALKADPRYLEARLARGIARMSLGLWQEAREDLSEVVREWPEFAEGLLLLADCSWRQGQRTQAIEELGRCQKTGLKTLSGLGRFTRLAAEMGQWDLGETAATEGVRRHGARAEAYKNRAELRARRGRWAEVEQDLTEALRHAPEDPDALFARAKAREALGDPLRAAEDASVLLKRLPSHYDARVLRGRCRELLRRFAEALSDYEAARLLRPDELEGHMGFGRAAAELARWDSVRDAAREILRLEENSPEGLYLSARAETGSGRPKKARELCTKLLERDGSHVPARLLRAKLALEEKLYEPAIEDCSRILEKDPGVLEAYFIRGNAYAARSSASSRDRVRARDDFAEFLLRAPQDDPRREEVERKRKELSR